MDPLSILQGALSLLGRPGNAVRGAIIDPNHLEGLARGLSDQQHYDGTDLPGINQLSDDGPSLGPLHLSPRAIGGFAGSALLDPLSYAGGALGRGAELLGGLGRGASAADGLLDGGARLGELPQAIHTLDDAAFPKGLTGGSLGFDQPLAWYDENTVAHIPELSGDYRGGITHPHFRLPDWGGPQGELDAADAESRFPNYSRLSRDEVDQYNSIPQEELKQRFGYRQPETAGDEMHQADDTSMGARLGRPWLGGADLDSGLFGNSNRMSLDPQDLVENVLERLQTGRGERLGPTPVPDPNADIAMDPSHNMGTEMYDVPERARYGPWPSRFGPQIGEDDPLGPATPRGTATSYLSSRPGGPAAQGLGPTNEVTPLGDQETAQQRDALYQNLNAKEQLKSRRDAMVDYLKATGNAEVDPETRQLIIHMKGSQEPVMYERGGQPDAIYPEQIRDAITDLDSQIEQAPTGLRDFQNDQARRDIAADPSLLERERYNQAANNAGKSKWMNANKYRQGLVAYRPEEGEISQQATTALDSTVRNVYNAMSGWKNAQDPDVLDTLTSKAVGHRSTDINESMKGYHRWYNAGANGIEDPNDPELLANQYSSRPMDPGEYLSEDKTRNDSSGTMDAGNYGLNAMRGGQVVHAIGEDRVSFPDLMSRAQDNDGMYRYLNDQGRGSPGSIPAREMDKLQQEDRLQRGDDIARQSLSDPVYPRKNIPAWSDSVDAHLERLAQPDVVEFGKNGRPDKYSPDLIGDEARSDGDYQIRDLIPEILKAEEAAGNPLTADQLVQLVARIGKPRDTVDAFGQPMARTPVHQTSYEPEINYQRGLPGDAGATLPETRGEPNTMILPNGQVVPLPSAPAAPSARQPWNYQQWVQNRMRQRPLPRG